jgi:hypothetical protein
MDDHFNTSKSNKHLWEAISAKMREQGFDRSPSMCTDKWRNLLKEFKKARSRARSSAAAGGNGSAKMAYYKEIDDLLKRRGKKPGSPAGSGGAAKSPTPSSKIESYLQFADKGMMRLLALAEMNTPSAFGHTDWVRISELGIHQ